MLSPPFENTSTWSSAPAAPGYPPRAAEWCCLATTPPTPRCPCCCRALAPSSPAEESCRSRRHRRQLFPFPASLLAPSRSGLWATLEGGCRWFLCLWGGHRLRKTSGFLHVPREGCSTLGGRPRQPYCLGGVSRNRDPSVPGVAPLFKVLFFSRSRRGSSFMRTCFQTHTKPK